MICKSMVENRGRLQTLTLSWTTGCTLTDGCGLGTAMNRGACIVFRSEVSVASKYIRDPGLSWD